MRRRPIERRDPLISPLFADLAGFPPLLIQVGSAETLLADATRLAAAAGAADVDVTLQDLAAHDPRLAGLECQTRRRPPRAGVRRPVHAGAYPIAALARGMASKPAPRAIFGCFSRNLADCMANRGF